MIDSIVRDIVPPGYDYADAWWFSSIKKKEIRSRKRLIITTLVTAGLAAVPFAVFAFLTGRDFNILISLCASAVFFLLLVYFLKTNNDQRVIPALLGVCILGLAILLVAPGSRDVYVLLFLSFPVLAYRVRGSIKGTIWVIASIFVWSFVIFLRYAGFLPVSTDLTFTQHGFMVISFLIIVFFSLLMQRQHERYVRDLVEKIMYDEVTGLPNKSVLQKTLSIPSRRLFAVIRIDNFTDLGTMFGFAMSGAMVSFVAHRLLEESSSFGYYVYRLKDNDFGLLFNHPYDAPDKNEAILDDLCERLSAQPLIWDDKDFAVTVHAGGVLVDETVLGGILHKADAALKVSESLHKRAIVFGAFADNSSLSEQDGIYQVLLRNRLNHEFKSYFQPVRDTLDGSIMWYECLLRVKGANGLYQNPLPYLSVARSTGIDQYIAQFMVEEACFAIIRTGYSFSINLTGADLMRDELIADICRKMDEIRHLEGTLIIECSGTEIEMNTLCVGNLSRLKLAGCSIAIDDFGAGFNNFLNLLKIDADFIKIHGSLVQQSAHDDKTESLLKGITQICQRSGKKVVAEYVENEHIARKMKQMGIDCLQGFYIGHPAERIA
jgi:EAL domain-containing protein (putative c-di-GMP-specific phosphodiesterase class I)/GGDEF domain-containing protein